MKHHFRDGCPGGHVSVSTLATSLSRETAVAPHLWKLDIRKDPGLYYPDYVELCSTLGVDPLPVADWLENVGAPLVLTRASDG